MQDNLARIDKVLALIRDERIVQDRQWAPVSQHGHSPYVWLALIQKQLGQAATELIEMQKYEGNVPEINRLAMRAQLIQAAAVIAAFIEDATLFIERMEQSDDGPVAIGADT